jgi:transcriptional regulator with XRE-family HTH domain
VTTVQRWSSAPSSATAARSDIGTETPTQLAAGVGARVPKKLVEESDDDRAALAARIGRLAAAAGSRKRAAELAGITAQQLGRLIAGSSAGPSATTLRRLALATGFDLHWVMTGEGSPTRTPPDVVNGLLLGRVVDALARVYKDAGVLLPGVELGRLAAEEYSDIARAGGDEAEQLAMVRAAAERHRRLLVTERPQARKRGA